jgi:Tol biopolymer transport system component
MSLASGTSDFAVSRNGTLAYVEGEGARQLVLVDRNGGATPLLSARASYAFPRFSPDGHRVALSIGAIGQSDVWVLDIRAGTLSRVTSDGMSTAPDWMPDGRRLAFGSLRHGMPSIFSQPWDKSDSSSLLVARASIPIIARSGGFLVTLGFQNGTDIERISLDSTRERRTLVGTPAADFMPDISPDGAWLAYVSLESGRSEVYVRAMTGAGGRRQISTDGAVEPRWGPDGRELFYRTNDQRMMVAKLRLTPELTVVGRDVLFADPFFRIAINTGYDVAPDGQHFVMVRAPDVQSALHIVFGWLDDLRTRSGATSEK